MTYTELGDGGFTSSLYSLSRLLETSLLICMGRLYGTALLTANEDDAVELMELSSRKSSLFFLLFLNVLFVVSLIEWVDILLVSCSATLSFSQACRLRLHFPPAANSFSTSIIALLDKK